jgi:SagB-type dehydrogenase family enzyme
MAWSRQNTRSKPLPLALAVVCALAPLCACDSGSASGGAETSGETVISLPAPDLTGEVSVERALASRRSVRAFAARPLPLSSVSQLLWAAQGITHPTGLRTAPSAGALYPLELYLVAGRVSDLKAGVYRYDPGAHRLVMVRPVDARAHVARAALGQRWIASAPATLVISAVYQRTERKYRERARRYVHLEAGHAAQSVYLQAAALGLGTTVVGAFQDGALARHLNLRTEEKPLALLPIGEPG